MSEKRTFENFGGPRLDSRWLVNLPDCCEHHLLEVEVIEVSPDGQYVDLYRVADCEDVWYPVNDVNVVAQLGDHPDDSA